MSSDPTDTSGANRGGNFAPGSSELSGQGADFSQRFRFPNALTNPSSLFVRCEMSTPSAVPGLLAPFQPFGLPGFSQMN